MSASTFAPGYRYWAACGLGSTVTTEDRMEFAPGLTMVSTTSMTLCALDGGKATVDMVVRNRVEGGPVEFPPTETLQEVEIPESPVEDPDFAAPGGPAVETDDVVEVAGQRIPCRRLERTVEAHGRRITFTVWVSDLVPGGLVRQHVQGDGERLTVVVSFLKK